MASPPPGMIFRFVISMNAAPTSSATPIPIWMGRRGRRDTTWPPNHPPSVPMGTNSAKVNGSTATATMNAKASNATGTDDPTFSVPGISSSRTIPVSLKMAVVGAKLPMPSVSKNRVTKPTRAGTGAGRPWGGRLARAARHQVTTKYRMTSARPASSTLIGLTIAVGSVHRRPRPLKSRGARQSGLDEREQFLVDAILVGGAHPVRRPADHDQLAVRHQLRRALTGRLDRYDLIIVAVQDQHRHVDLLQVVAVVDLPAPRRLVLASQAALKADRDERILEALRYLRALSIRAVERHRD